jgi:hypothetical protein
VSPDKRTERVVIETDRYRITGSLTLPKEGYRSRLSDFLNQEEVSFVSVIDAWLTPLDGGEPERRDYVAVARDHMRLVYPDARAG